MGPEKQVPSVDLETPPRNSSPPQDSECLAEPFTPNQQTIDRLTQELAQLTRENKKYAEMIADLHKENQDLRIQVKSVEDLNKSITSSRDSHQKRHNILKE